jgi:NADPH-dependent ferric siderophore reductase
MSQQLRIKLETTMTATTADTDPRAIQRLRHETRLRLMEVIGITDVTPLMRRFHLKGDLAGFASPGHADHIKAFFFPAGVFPKLVPIGPNGAEFAPGEKPQMRDYTPRYFDVAAGTLDLDFVLHGDGPAASWAASARVGSSLVIGGPRGSQVVPAAFDWYLLAGDETALPALGRRIEELPQGSRVVAVIEVAGPEEEQRFETCADLTLVYVHRNGAPAGTTTLVRDHLATMDLPTGDAYAYIAGEAMLSRSIREVLETRGFNPQWIKAAGYWQLGTADAQLPH